MGGNASPELADLTLSVSEYKYSLQHPHILDKNLYRYVDDILLLDFNIRILKEIYTSLELEVNDSSQETTFLHLRIYNTEIEGMQFRVYDKRDDFSFKVRRWIEADSNVSPQMFKNLLISQFIRYGRLIICKEHFIEKCQDIVRYYDNELAYFNIRKIVQNFVFKNALLVSKYTYPSHNNILRLENIKKKT